MAGGFGAVELLAEAIDATSDETGGLDAAAIRDYLFRTATKTVLGPYRVAPPGNPEAGAQQALKGLQVQWQDDGNGGLVQRIIHPAEVADAEACFWR